MWKRLLSLLLSAVLLPAVCTSAAAESGGMDCSDGLIDYIREEEGFRAEAYFDGGNWFIGYGSACEPADYPRGITEEQADALLRSRMDGFAADVNRFLNRYGVTVDQAQFDALCAMSYNFGSGWLNPENRLPSWLIGGIRYHTDQEIASAFGAWCHLDGAVSEPLLRRRIKEAKLFLYGDYGFTYEGWSWLILDPNGGSVESDVALYRTGEPYGTLPEAAAERGFAGWRTADGRMLRAADTVTENLRVAAVWSDAAVPAGEAAREPREEPGGAGTPVEPERSGIFPDVPADAWYAGYVETLAERGVVGGYEDGTFRPDNSVTWGEALKLILTSAGFPERQAEGDGHWASGYLKSALEKRYLTAERAGNIQSLDDAITRSGVAELCAAALELPVAADGETPYADTDGPGALALYAAGIMEGSVDGEGRRLFRGGDAISRAEACAVLDRMLGYVAEHFVFVSGERAPINFELAFHSYETEAFATDGRGRVSYAGAAEAVRYGVDVSFYQGDIDWAEAAADGVDFAIIRCGYRGYGAGSLNEDPKFRQNIAGALAAGLDVGIYFFSQATTAQEAREEAEFTLRLIQDYDITFPVVCDWEQITARSSRTRDPDWAAVTDCIAAFCDAVSAAGYTPMTYFNKHMSYLQLDMSRLQAYDGWLAWYHEVPDYIYDYQMWQYSSAGSVAGISGSVDMNICFVDYGAE